MNQIREKIPYVSYNKVHEKLLRLQIQILIISNKESTALLLRVDVLASRGRTARY